jgi:hypothetical protein
MEPFVYILNQYKLKKSAIPIMKEYLSSNPLNKQKINCTNCKTKDDKSGKITKKGIRLGSIELCSNCMDKLRKDLDEVEEKIEKYFRYYDKSGFLIQEIDAEIVDFIQNKKVNSNCIIQLSTDRLGPLRTDISNINELINGLSKIDTRDFIIRNSSDGSCISCSKSETEYIFRQTRVMGGNFCLCDDCRINIRDNLKSFRDDNIDEILSKSL